MYKSYSDLGSKPQPNRDLFSVLELNDAAHKNQVLSQNRIVLVDVFTNWCQPCKQIEPEYSILAKKYNNPGQCAIVKENFDKKLSQNIQGVPTFHIYKGGRIVDEVVGADLKDVEEKLQVHLQTPDAPTQFNQQEQNQGHGPQFSRNSIRQTPSPYHGQNMPGQSGQPYNPNADSYHRPYQQGAPPPQHHQPQSHQFQGGVQGGNYGPPQGFSPQPQGMQMQGHQQGMQMQGPPPQVSFSEPSYQHNH